MTRRERALVVKAAENIEDGQLDDAHELLLIALEEDEDASGPPPCDVCGVRAWPGQAERHIRSLHRPAESLRAA